MPAGSGDAAGDAFCVQTQMGSCAWQTSSVSSVYEEMNPTGCFGLGEERVPSQEFSIRRSNPSERQALEKEPSTTASPTDGHSLAWAPRPGEGESLLCGDAGWVVPSKALESLVSRMNAQLGHLLLHVQRKDVGDEAFASLEGPAEELAAAGEEFVHVARRLAEDSKEQQLREEVESVAGSLRASGRDIVLVAQKLHLQPGSQRHREELVAAARQILVGTAQVLLLEDSAAARKAVCAAARGLAGLQALELAGDVASLRRALAALAAALLSLGRLGHPLRGCLPALLAVAQGHRGHPWDPQLAASRRHVSALLRASLGELLARLEPLAGPGQLHGPQARLDAVEWPCLAGLRGPGGTGLGRPEPCLEAGAQDARSGLLHQILATFTDTQGPLQRLVQAALASLAIGAPGEGEDSGKTLKLSLAAFHGQAARMVRVSHVAQACCSGPQPARDLEAAAAQLWGLALQLLQLFSPNPQGPGARGCPATLPALLPAWARACARLLACLDHVLPVPEFLRESVQEMHKHLDSLQRGARAGDASRLSRAVACLRGRATHVAQLMSRFLSQARDPIFRNGLRVLIWQLEQSSSLLGAAAQRSSGGSGSQDTDVLLTLAKQLICSAEKVRDGLDGTNHPDILSPLREQVPRSGVILPSLWDSAAPGLQVQSEPGFGESGPDWSYSPRGHYYHCLLPDARTQSRAPPRPATRELILAAEGQGHQATSSCAHVLEQEAATAGEGPRGSERTTGLQEAWTQPPAGTDPARAMACLTTARSDQLLEAAPWLSGGASEASRGVGAMVGDWYSLCRQLFCQVPKSDLPESTAVFTELQQNLASLVQLAAKRGPRDLDKKHPGSMGLPEELLQTQSRLKEVEVRGRQLLDRALASDGLQTAGPWGESGEHGRLLWSTAVQALVQDLQRLGRRQGLCLLPLRQAVRDRRGLQEGLAQAEDVSQRLQEAARLSWPLCGDAQARAAVSLLCGEVLVLRDALLDVARALASAPSPAPSLSTRFELLCVEFALRARALTGHLSSVNADYEQAFQDAVCPGLSGGENPPARPESALRRMASGIRAVLGIVAQGQESGPGREGLLVALERVLVLTQEAAQRAPGLQEGPERTGPVLDWLRAQWAARAHHAVAMLQACRGGQSEACRLLEQSLKGKAGPGPGPGQPQLRAQEAAAGAGAAAQGAARRATAGDSVGLDAAKPAGTGTQQNGPPGCPGPRADLDQPAQEDGGMDSESRIAQLTREMAKEVFLMTRSLRRRGCVLTKDQLITSARKVAVSSQDFSRLIRIIAKNCTDQSCSRELFCAVEQIETLSSQLRIISSVQASLARSKSSGELLAGSARRLLQAVRRALSAAEAASLRGLGQPSDDPEEQEVAALCMKWRRKLLRCRLQETSNVDCDELGLRKTSMEKPPALAALVQEAL